MDSQSEVIITGLRFYRVLELSQVLSQAAILEKLEVKTREFTHEPLMTTEVVHIRLGRQVYSPLISRNKASLLACFEPALSVKTAMDYLSPSGIIVMNTNSVLSPFNFPNDESVLFLERMAKKTVKVDIFQIAKETGQIRKYNFLLLGILSGLDLIPIAAGNIIRAIQQSINRLDQEAAIKALESGILASPRYKT